MTQIWAVIPARNEGQRIYKAIESASQAGADEILVIDNGSADDTKQIARDHPHGPRVLSFSQALGPDIPRAVGAQVAISRGANIVLFLDGDMTGDLAECLKKLIWAVTRQEAMALTNPFPYGPPTQGLAGEVCRFRLLLNRTVGWAHLGASIMSHGPSAVSRRLLLTVGFRTLGHPPVAMACAARSELGASVVWNMSHEALGGAGRDRVHAQRMAETIIGDCIQAIHTYNRVRPQRSWRGTFYDGYDSQRCWAWLDRYLETTNTAPPRPCT